MKYDHILIRYGELALKGKNRKDFENKLKENIQFAIREHRTCKVKRTYGRMFIELHDENPNDVLEKLKHIFGISSFSLAMKTENDVEAIKEGALQAFLQREGNNRTFKVSARRSYKPFPIRSQDLNQHVGAHILRNTENVTVDVHNPDVEVVVEVREQGTYITCGRIDGAGGLPVGTAGKVALMLSGGIDSPVAGYLAMKRGAEIEAVHFHSPPYTNERARKKVEDLTNILTKFGGSIRLHIVPFTELQKAIHAHIPSSYSMTIMRRMMLRITERIAQKQDAKAVVNGESLGQVASQTLESMHTINEVTNIPILRPLVTMDKQEVVEVSEQIGTYDISVLPYEDCCTIFLPSDSVTKPRRDKAVRFEEAFDFEPYINEAVQYVETLTIGNEQENKTEQKMNDLL
ncbi:thiamine biosynthesis protein ThiI [Alteribacillus persepolensis]|uniref:Probable tRNA sulfurtransferase n=1 Tax=Alteribacillus persepolensis TaxID=568899 RepID=A0A1G8BF86_9BACI|nr:tRNA uracil 4-sulfurtransferase ThiI [Alteribacillus persepolensis]SDH31895.1 thiamine biosynthesis protein ThiI [Alteribacillus persepolensis]